MMGPSSNLRTRCHCGAGMPYLEERLRTGQAANLRAGGACLPPLSKVAGASLSSSVLGPGAIASISGRNSVPQWGATVLTPHLREPLPLFLADKHGARNHSVLDANWPRRASHTTVMSCATKSSTRSLPGFTGKSASSDG